MSQSGGVRAADPLAGRKPSWLRVSVPGGDRYRQVRETLASLHLATVCQGAHCPNLADCWEAGTATIMLMGDTCTRGCRFCAVTTSRRPAPLDPGEPRRVAEAVARLRLDYVVLTSVDRDDLPDGGAGHFAEAIARLRAVGGPLVEALTPDFGGNPAALRAIGRAGPDVFGHNIETVRRLSPAVRDARAGYDRSLAVLEWMKREFPGVLTKSSIMLGLGEVDAEIDEAMRDLRSVGVELLTLGQYLRPTPRHVPVAEWIAPGRFGRYRDHGMALGFRHVASGPLVRSSYRAAEPFLGGEAAYGIPGGRP